MAILTPALLSAMNTVYRRDFQSAYDAAREATFWSNVATMVPSASASNTYGWLGDFPALIEWVGDRTVKDMKAHGYELINKLYEATVGVPRTAIEDDSYGVYSPLMRTMGQAAADHPDKMISELIAAGHSTLCFDGQNFFDTDHPVYPNVDGTGVAATVSNYDADAGSPGPLWVLLDTTKPLKPFIFQERTKPEFEAKTNPATSDTVFTSDTYQYGIRYRCNAGFGFWQMAYGSRNELNATNFRAARQAMREFTADGGRPLGIRPNVVLVPPALEADAKTLFEAMTLANGASNPDYKAVEVIVSGWMA